LGLGTGTIPFADYASHYKSLLTISAELVGIEAASQPWIVKGERCLSLMRIAMMGSVSSCVRMRS